LLGVSYFSIFNFICGTLLAGKITSLWRGAILPHSPHCPWLLDWSVGLFFYRIELTTHSIVCQSENQQSVN
jgi:hypothetical protein